MEGARRAWEWATGDAGLVEPLAAGTDGAASVATMVLGRYTALSLNL